MGFRVQTSRVHSMKNLNFFEITSGSFLALGARYAVFAGLCWWLGYVLYKQRWFHRKIIARFPVSTEVRREVRYSALSMLIFAIVGGLTAELSRRGHTQLYWKISDHGWAWFWASIGLTILLHDAYFYWSHRLMHHRRLFPYFHRVHHLSHNPTPWAAYAFSPSEAVIQAGIFPLAAFLMPLHPFAFAIFMGWQITFNVLGHLGYEFYPRWALNSWLGRIMNTPTSHILHHEKMRGHYGIYFNLWDRLMGTNHTEYEKRFEEVTSRPRADQLGLELSDAVSLEKPRA
jgi:sterol desaturase/sphingolipid hydroxylase (fatty acid hydroxylase superfamily)